MDALLYRPDWAEARERLTRWWQGEDLGRAAMQISAPRSAPWEEIEPLPEPEGWTTIYSTLDLEYHVNVRLRGAASADYFGEAVPAVNSGDLAPNCLALYLGCQGQERPGTVWCEPFVRSYSSSGLATWPRRLICQSTTTSTSRGSQMIAVAATHARVCPTELKASPRKARGVVFSLRVTSR